jgi:hypothetical protein
MTDSSMEEAPSTISPVFADLDADHDIHAFIRQHLGHPKASPAGPPAEGIGEHFD